ncbi:MAG: hypothetical protein WD823_01235 [Sulfuricaulis sp.]|uniref:hypothetical protein n=1 Tax=Sulfuricaulis sp. TaxID=2003553 RepID=UPI0034A21615
MSFFRKLFGKREESNNVAHVRAILEKFIEASFIPLSGIDEKSSSHGMTILLYMFGAVDMVCQVKGVDQQTTMLLFNEMLQNELGEYTDKEAEALLKEVIKASAEPEGQQLMKEGAEALRLWLTESDLAVPYRLTELLKSKGK